MHRQLQRSLVPLYRYITDHNLNARGIAANEITPGRRSFCRREYLQSPYDLVKVAAFRRKLEKEKASIDARLKSDQLDATREGLKKLLSMRNHVQVLKEEMQTIDRLYRPAERRIDI
ncbi:hypothetical protein L210DRAFT_3763592 [Boletus edulis BED1]|uniref:Uncharacterized protein n=1 Tax=Boletus edulis BED1 TaxID=1328754 RepID=A0AAD4G9W1_BOLED|nr:hypothetical protein L210DRAFT_3763592 [Boletus edulis BED1]